MWVLGSAKEITYSLHFDAILIPSRVTGNFEPHNFSSWWKLDNKNNTKATRKGLISFMYFTCYAVLQINIPMFKLIEMVHIYGEHT